MRPDPAAARPGGSAAPLVLLLHGLGGIWWSLRRQMEALAGAGFHAVAVDLRGHGDSDKPPRGYDAWTLASDVTNLIRALGHSEAIVAGHGEGGFVAWTAAYRRPRAVTGLVVLASGHPLAVRHAALRDGPQRRALVPALLANQPPRLPERRLVADRAAAVESMLRERSGPAWPGTEDFRESAEVLRTAMLVPKVAHLSLETQRWMFRSQFRIDGRDFRRTVDGLLPHPVLGVCGAEDRYLFTDTVRGSARWAPELEIAEIAGAGHHPMMECPEPTSAAMVDFAERVSASPHTSRWTPRR